MVSILQIVAVLMIVIGVGIMINSTEQPVIVGYQVLILGGMFFGLGIITVGISQLKNSIDKQTEFFSELQKNNSNKPTK